MTDDHDSRKETKRTEKPQGKSLEEWVKGWHRWFLGIPENKHPTLSDSPMQRLQDQDQNDPRTVGMSTWNKSDNKVWFLAGGYGGPVNTRSFLPVGKFHILAPVFTVFASQDEYPELDTIAKLNAFCKEDVEYAELSATLDGESIIPYHVKIDTPFSVTLPSDNILGIPRYGSRREGIMSNINIVADGYWIWLEPLDRGDHRLYTYGYARHYVSELKISLSVPGSKR
jgi:hypothetical protein